MDHEAVLTAAYDDPDSARLVERSIALEVDEIDGDRTQALVEREGATLTVTIQAADLVALRAGLTTWSGLVEVAEGAAGI
ncbi:rpo operon protein [Halorhabdus sp. CBA1104]|uniref:KEOPS complex subunit Pcc1 n=1 Tax=unclassified Halorhabdus TaxID=2621901 RepID=UPI0012B28D9A|nr:MULTISPECIES: KEOPS complex subunit Pcc1 [unclassified Halorhabdus]QGN06175.1 rpo operon protein [Halorhabdus sp. CBA1104]